MELKNEFARMEALLSHRNQRAESISASDIGWHIDHSLMVITSVADAVASSSPADYRWTFSMPRFLVMGLLGRIPRGKAKAPKVVAPKNPHTEEMLREKLEQAKAGLQRIAQAEPGQFFPHPYFGHIRRDDTVKFLGIHTRHHLAIADDILRSA